MSTASALVTASPVPQLQYEIVIVPKAGHPDRDSLLKQCFDLRLEVFSKEQGFSAETEFDESAHMFSFLTDLQPYLIYRYEEIGTHIILRLTPSKEPIGTIRVVPLEDYYKVTRLVVLENYRKYKLGRALMQALHEWSITDALAKGRLPGSTIECRAHSQIYAKGFYMKCVAPNGVGYGQY